MTPLSEEKISRKELIRQYNAAIRELHESYGEDITAYEADLQAAKGREDLLREELAKANKAWTTELRLRKDTELNLYAANDQLGAAKAELAEVQADRDGLDREVGTLRRLVSSIRSTVEELHRAVFPATYKPPVTPKPPLTFPPYIPQPVGIPGTLGPIFGFPPGTVTINNAVQDKVDRLEEAGYNCNRESAVGYSGLMS